MKSVISFFVSGLLLLSTLTGCGGGLEVLAAGAAVSAMGAGMAQQGQNNKGSGATGSGLNQSVAGPSETQWTLQFSSLNSEGDRIFYNVSRPPAGAYWETEMEKQAEVELRGDTHRTMHVIAVCEDAPKEIDILPVDLREDLVRNSHSVTLAVYSTPWRERTDPGSNDLWVSSPVVETYTVPYRDITQKEWKGFRIRNPFTYQPALKTGWHRTYFAIKYNGPEGPWGLTRDDEKRLLYVDVVTP